MGDWSENAVSVLLNLAKKDPELAKIIRGTILKLDKNPGLGTFLIKSVWSYTDLSGKFRIIYNYSPEQKIKKIEIESIIIP
ncbi:MAG: hypothetical protein HQM12_23680 [SAR324 cluster bacterium]|nr:hypothetical protein [SAR324 cluster bacterium]